MNHTVACENRKPDAGAGLRAVLRRELSGMSNTGIGWLVAALMLSLSSVSFFWIAGFFEQDVASLDAYFDIWPAIFAFLIPALTMRSFAEERSSGMHEVLSVLPVSTGMLVTAKFSAVALFIVGVLLCATPVAFGVSLLGELPFALVATQSTALLLLAWSMISVGLFVSALSANQLTAYVITTVVLILLSFLHVIPSLLGLGGTAVEMARTISLDARFEQPAEGLLSIADIGFFIVVIVVFLRATTHALNARRY